jgi:hypothetical protein
VAAIVPWVKGPESDTFDGYAANGLLKAPIFFDHVTIMPLTSRYGALFHVKHPMSRQIVAYFRLERRHPQLGGRFANKRHESSQVFPIQFRGGIIKQ